MSAVDPAAISGVLDTRLSCSTASCRHVSPSVRQRVLECRAPKFLALSMAFAQEIEARLPLGPTSPRGGN
ncbi:MAG: hypothetical protein ACYDEY_05665 [Acidimicrobiales bacterium]